MNKYYKKFMYKVWFTSMSYSVIFIIKIGTWYDRIQTNYIDD